MKKSIITAVLVAAVSMTASAVTFNWASSAALSFGSTQLKSNPNVSAYLLALDPDLLPSYTVDSLFKNSTIGTVVSSTDGTPKSGKVTGLAEFDFGTYENGDKFALLLSYNDAASEKTYWNLSADVLTISGIVDPSSSLTDAVFSFNGNIADSEGTLTAGGGWAPAAIPEPATGALALAGLALLFRRKRA